MRKIVIPVFLILAIAILGSANYIYFLLRIFSQENHWDFGSLGYVFVIATYICIIFIVWIEQENLGSWNLDRLSLSFLVVFAFLRINLHTPQESNYKILIAVLGLSLFVLRKIYWKKIPQTNTYWTIIGLLSCFL